MALLRSCQLFWITPGVSLRRHTGEARISITATQRATDSVGDALRFLQQTAHEHRCNKAGDGGNPQADRDR